MKNIYRTLVLIILFFLLLGCTGRISQPATQTLLQPTSTQPIPALPATVEATVAATTVVASEVAVDSPTWVLLSSHDGAEQQTTPTACRAFGWLVDSNDRDIDLTVRVLVDGVEVAQDTADDYRPDLDMNSVCPDGTCAFEVDLWPLLTPGQPHTVVVQGQNPATSQWADLEGSPRQLTCIKPVAAGEDPNATPQVTVDASGRTLFQLGKKYLIIEFLDDDLVHFELSGVITQTDLGKPLYTSPMVAKKDYPGVSNLVADGKGSFETRDLKIKVDPETLCLSATDKTRTPELLLTTLCPQDLGQSGQAINLTQESFTHAYGLGQEFITLGSSEGDWVGRVRSPGSGMGNAMVGWNGGGVGNTQIPIVYFAGQGLDSYALFADNTYRQRWDFTRAPWKAELGGNWLRFYLMSGPDLQDLRQDYLELTGRPPVPPKKMFGLWISEYGYDNWRELDSKLWTLRQNQFPVDGFVLDLQWFGGIQGNDNTRMGSLSWDLTRFPNPADKIATLRDTQGIGILTIEESYIGKNLPEHADLAKRGYLALDCEGCPATYLTGNPWWGKGGMMDWSNPAGASYWHDLKRQPLLQAGVLGFWTDLGEPEMYHPDSWYWGIPGDYTPLHSHADVHNLFNLLWSESIFAGFQRNQNQQRPFILSRSGTAGSQRYGVSMWSGDIGSNMPSLATQMNAQLHMSLSGIDYYGSDIGGFRREALDGDMNELYTQWFANSMAFDIPGRAHVENLCNCKETAPDRVGDLQSNLANVRLRYELSPYMYSLSHRAYLYGEPLIPPLVYYYQGDPNVRELGHEKLLGRDLLVAIVAGYGEKERQVYLPAGEWVNYYNNEVFTSKGDWFGPFATYLDGKFRLPLFARRGAIIPQMYVDEKTMNILGKRSDGSRRDELIVRVFASPQASSFTLYEDDGTTVAYQQGEVRTTLLSQQATGQGVTVTVAAAQGTYAGAPDSRDNVVRLVVANEAQITQVSLNGAALVKYNSQTEWEAAESGWYYAGNNLVVAKSGKLPVGEQKVFVFAGN